MNASPSQEMKLEISLSDPRAIEIVESISADKKDEVIEKYIILGEMVASHASITTRKEAVADFFEPLNMGMRELLTNQHAELNMDMQKLLTNQYTELTNQRTELNMIREQLQLIVPTVTTSAKKGEITVDAIFQSLQERFLDDSFEDVSATEKYSDILATTSTKTPVLIEIKDYKNNVPSGEVDKFWRDLARRGARYGIFVSMHSGITKCSGSINIKTEMNRTAVFVVNYELNWVGHIFAFQMIKKLSEIESVKKKELKGQELGKVITKINSKCKQLQKDVEILSEITRIADRLKTSNTNKLDELIDLANKHKRSLKEQIEEIIDEITNVEL